jgi:hypothetical protein
VVSIVSPRILFSQCFWWTIAFVLIIAFYFARKKSPPPSSGARKFLRKFSQKHEKRIIKMTNILAICMVLLWSYVLLPIAWVDLKSPIESESTQTFVQHLGFMCTFAFLTIWSGVSGFRIGLLSVFHSNITIMKRIILLIICLLPIVFTILQMLTEIIESPSLMVQNCLFFSAGSWIINMPAALVGKSSFELLGNTIQKLRLVFGHHAE